MNASPDRPSSYKGDQDRVNSAHQNSDFCETYITAACRSLNRSTKPLHRNTAQRNYYSEVITNARRFLFAYQALAENFIDRSLTSKKQELICDGDEKYSACIFNPTAHLSKKLQKNHSMAELIAKACGIEQSTLLVFLSRSVAHCGQTSAYTQMSCVKQKIQFRYCDS